MNGFPILPVHIILLGVMLIGLFSLLLVVVPGLVIVWAAISISILIHGIPNGFDCITIGLFGFETIIMLIGNVIDNLIIGVSAKEKGASWMSLGAALIAGIIGSILFPPVGGLLMAPIGLMLAETIRMRDVKKAFTSTKGLAAGCGWVILIRFLLAAVMIAAWIIWSYYVLLP